MKKFMVIHHNPGIDCSVVQSNWRKLAEVESATWLRTYFNEERGVRYCLWLANNDEILENIFNQMDVAYHSILPVKETMPDLWGAKWEEHLNKDAVADTLGN